MNRLMQDVRFALRQMRKAPGFTATAVITLALGLAATSTIFSWISSTLLNPIPGVTDTARMITLMRGERNEHPTPPFSYPDFVDLRSQARSFTGMLGYHDDYMSITGNGTPERIFGALTTADYFEVLGVKPMLGRSLMASRQNERAGLPEAVLSYELWQRRYGGDPGIIGKTIQINLHPFTVVGIAPRDFIGCKSGLRTDIWLPLGMDRAIWGSKRIDDRSSAWLNALAVLRPGVDRRAAEVEVNTLMQQLVARYPAAHQGNNTITADPLWRSPFGANVYWAGTLPILLALAAVLLLLACANVANLLLVRSVARRREFALRLSIGASRFTLVRQLMIENLLLALGGGALAIVGTKWLAGTLPAFLPSTSLPLAMRTGLDQRTTLLSLGICIATAVLSGILPAWRASHLAPISVLKEDSLAASGSVHNARLSSVLVVAQVALSLLLLVCAGLFMRSLQKAQAADPGFDPNHVLVATLDLSPMGYSGAQGREFQRQLVARVQQIPGVTSAAVADFSPLSFTIHTQDVMPQGYVRQPHESMEVDRGSAGPGFLRTLRTPLLEGRDFTEADNASAQPVAIVNQALAARYWPGQDAVGKQISDGGSWRTIVGLMANSKYRRLLSQPAPMLLLPLAQRYQSEVILHVRSNSDPMLLTNSIEQAVHALNPNLPLYNVTTMEENMGMGSIFERIAVTFAGSFGVLALLLAAIGLYAVIAYTTRQRTREIGIRMALGADRNAILRQVFKQGLWLTFCGVAVGLGGSLICGRFLRGMLYGIGGADWVTFASVSALLCVVSLLACYVPARRAAAIEPMRALRTE